MLMGSGTVILDARPDADRHERPHDSVTSFSAAGAGSQVLNSLPPALRGPELTFDRLKLKTYLFTLV